MAAARERTPKESEETVVRSASVVSQESMVSSSDEGMGPLEIFLRDKLDSLNGEGLEKF